MATYNYVFNNAGSIVLNPNTTNLLYGLATIVYSVADAPTSLTIAPSGQVSFYAPGSPPQNVPAAVDLVRGSITNFGGIQNLSASGVRFDRGGDLTNYGTINGDTLAVEQRVSATSLDIAITNAGLIVGPTAISLLGASTGTVVNAGTGGIYATGAGGKAIDKTAGTLSLTNYGAIGGAVASAGGNDTVVNNGSIVGNIDLGAGNDTYGGVGLLDGTVLGGDGNDTLTGGLYNDILNGGADNDVLNGGSGIDLMTGGSGDDTFHIDARGDKAIEAVGGGNDTVYASVSYVLRAGQEIETLSVNPDADFADIAIGLTGNEFANTLIGNAAANKLDGTGGADTMIGGDGNDTYCVDDAGDVIFEAVNQGTDTVHTSVSHTLSANVENLRAQQGTADIDFTGNGLANAIVGNAGANRIDGGADADSMTGGAGNDTYVVDNVLDTVVEKVDGGTDTIEASVSYTLHKNVETLILTGVIAIDGTGNAVANTIIGNDGANTISGKGGFDTLTGGGGGDTFVFAHKPNAALNLATITDFEIGVDRIALDDAIFRHIGGGGELDEAFFTTSAPTTRDQHVIYDQATGQLSYDSDGSGAKPAIAFAQVTADTLLDHTAFLIV